MYVEYIQFANQKVMDNSLSIDEFRNDKIFVTTSSIYVCWIKNVILFTDRSNMTVNQCRNRVYMT